MSDSWCSPPEVADPLEEFFGGPVGTDPCSNRWSIIRARRIYTIGGLHLPWGDGTRKYSTAYANNPYSASSPWIDKGLAELEADHLTELVYLVMSVPSTTWWRKACAFDINPRILITKRLCFIEPVGSLSKSVWDKRKRRWVRPKKGRQNARFDTALIYYGRTRRRREQFDRAFASITSWSTWGRSCPA